MKHWIYIGIILGLVGGFSTYIYRNKDKQYTRQQVETAIAATNAVQRLRAEAAFAAIHAAIERGEKDVRRLESLPGVIVEKDGHFAFHVPKHNKKYDVKDKDTYKVYHIVEGGYVDLQASEKVVELRGFIGSRKSEDYFLVIEVKQ